MSSVEMNVMKKLAIIVFGFTCLLSADDGSKQFVQVTNTEHMEFPSGGTLRLKNSIGNLRVEGWDQPSIEITTFKSTKNEYDTAEREMGARELEQVHISVERHDNELVIGTDFHRHGIFVHPLRGDTRFDLDYSIKVPHSAQLFVDHDDGHVFVNNLTGSIHATVRKGQITLSLPEKGRYAIDARSKFGGVVSDFPGQVEPLWLLGHGFVNPPSRPVGSGSRSLIEWLVGQEVASPAQSDAQKLYLRVGSGDIVIFKMPKPNASTPRVQ